MTWQQYQSALKAKQAKQERAWAIKVVTLSIVTAVVIVLIGAGLIKGGL